MLAKSGSAYASLLREVLRRNEGNGGNDKTRLLREAENATGLRFPSTFWTAFEDAQIEEEAQAEEQLQEEIQEEQPIAVARSLLNDIPDILITSILEYSARQDIANFTLTCKTAHSNWTRMLFTEVDFLSVDRDYILKYLMASAKAGAQPTSVRLSMGRSANERMLFLYLFSKWDSTRLKSLQYTEREVDNFATLSWPDREFTSSMETMDCSSLELNPPVQELLDINVSVQELMLELDIKERKFEHLFFEVLKLAPSLETLYLNVPKSCYTYIVPRFDLLISSSITTLCLVMPTARSADSGDFYVRVGQAAIDQLQLRKFTMIGGCCSKLKLVSTSLEVIDLQTGKNVFVESINCPKLQYLSLGCTIRTTDDDTRRPFLGKVKYEDVIELSYPLGLLSDGYFKEIEVIALPGSCTLEDSGMFYY